MDEMDYLTSTVTTLAPAAPNAGASFDRSSDGLFAFGVTLAERESSHWLVALPRGEGWPRPKEHAGATRSVSRSAALQPTRLEITDHDIQRSMQARKRGLQQFRG
jgi:hypothetical protein